MTTLYKLVEGVLEPLTPAEMEQRAIDEAEAAKPRVPVLVYATQAKLALYEAGLLSDIKQIVANHPYEPVRIWFEDARDWERGHPYIQAIGIEKGLTDDDIDALFIAASKL